MTEFRRGQLERAIEQQLPEGRAQQIGAAHHLGDALSSVIHGDGKLVGRDIVLSPDYEIAKVDAGDGVLSSGAVIEKLQRFTFRNAKTPVHPERIFRLWHR